MFFLKRTIWHLWGCTETCDGNLQHRRTSYHSTSLAYRLSSSRHSTIPAWPTPHQSIFQANAYTCDYGRVFVLAASASPWIGYNDQTNTASLSDHRWSKIGWVLSDTVCQRESEQIIFLFFPRSVAVSVSVCLSLFLSVSLSFSLDISSLPLMKLSFSGPEWWFPPPVQPNVSVATNCLSCRTFQQQDVQHQVQFGHGLKPFGFGVTKLQA